MVNELSVLIPVYNLDIRPLVRALHQQCRQENLAFEILCFDDGSRPEVVALNQEVLSLTHTRYEGPGRHLGRAAIRNKLAREARFDYLLFLDNDSQLIRPDFIRRYLHAASQAPVLLGGTCYQAHQPPAPYRLRWRYGRRREERPASRRNQAPYHAFYLNNIFLAREVLLRFPLQVLPRAYGHEDSAFGRQLEAAGIGVRHLDNPVLHAGLEPADVFLRKSRQAVENLYWLYCRQGLGASTRLVWLYRQMKRFRLLAPFRCGYNVMEPLILNNLQGPGPRLWLFDLYKLYWFARWDK